MNEFQVIDQFLQAMADAGVKCNSQIIADGQRHRFKVDGDKHGTSGFYTLYMDSIPAGSFGCWKRGISATWCSKDLKTLMPDEKAAYFKRMEDDRLARQKEEKKRHDEAAKKANELWEFATPADNSHPYLVRKGVKSYGLKLATWHKYDDDGNVWLTIENALLVPIKNGKNIISMQAIFSDKIKALHDRDKDYLSGGAKKCGYFAIGKPSTEKPTIVICEGYSTGASIHQCTGYPVLVAFDKGNIEPVAIAVRDNYPYARIIIAADNDQYQPEIGNGGIDFATKAANAIKGQLLIPEFDDLSSKPTDFNDYHAIYGDQAVRDFFDPPEIAISTDNNQQFEAPIDIFAEFPVPSMRAGMLPEVIEQYADECGELIGVDLSMVAIPAIVACAAAIHDGFKIQPKRHEKEWTESARLWCAIVGDPSVKKTPAISRGTKRLRKINADLSESNQRKMADYMDQMTQVKDARKADKGTFIPDPERPMMERVIVEDITIEALSEVLKDNDRGVLCINDELSGWFGSMDAYSGGKTGGKDRSKWLQIYNGGSMTIDRIMRGSVHVKNWSACMIGGIQPDSIRKIAASMPEDGLMQRFMIVIGKNAHEFDRIENLTIKKSYSDLIDKLFSMQPSQDSVTLSKGAQLIRDELKNYGDALASYKMLPGGMRSHLGKWPGLSARLMLTYHVIECASKGVHPNDHQVSEQTAKQVDLLMRDFLLPHALSYYTDILGGVGDLEHARWIAGYVLSKKLSEISNRDMVQAYKNWRGMDGWQRDRVMQTLDDMGWLKPVKSDSSYNKRRATAWKINPAVHTIFEDFAKLELERRNAIKDEIKDIYRRSRENS